MIEIERKFLVRDTGWTQPLTSRRIEQGYLFIEEDRTLRVRRSDDDYSVTLKVQIEGLSRHEIETDIDSEQGQKMLDQLCVLPPICKTRHEVLHEGKTWEIDVFDGVNEGLIVAEIELSSEDEAFVLPSWAGPEISDDNRFLNAVLSQHPFSEWGVTYQELLAKKESG